MQFNAVSRSEQGTSASRRLRRAGRVPAIVYGGKDAAASVELDHNEIFHSLRNEAFHASILDLSLDGKVQKVLLRSVQWHPYKPLVLHVDFQRVSATEAITTRVPLRFLNGEESPAAKMHHQVITHVLTDLEITCLPADLPSSIEVDLINLDDGGNVYLDDIELPEGVTYAGSDTNPVLAAALVRGGADEEDEDVEDAEDDESAEGESNNESEE